MTDYQELLETEQQPTGKRQSAQHETVDWFLQSLVAIANRSGFEIGITLNVGGSIISGILVGGAKYFDGVAEEWRIGYLQSGGKSEDADFWKSTISEFSKIYKESIEKQEQAAREGTQPESSPGELYPEYIHLKDAQMHYSGQDPIPANRGIWWRGRLQAVDGFSLGSLTITRK